MKDTIKIEDVDVERTEKRFIDVNEVDEFQLYGLASEYLEPVKAEQVINKMKAGDGFDDTLEIAQTELSEFVDFGQGV
jgi:hypothetical protein